MDTAELQRAIERVRKIMETYPGGSSSPAVLRALPLLILQFHVAIGRGPALEALPSLEHWLSVYYSPRKHRRVLGGVAEVRSRIYESLEVIGLAAASGLLIPSSKEAVLPESRRKAKKMRSTVSEGGGLLESN